MPALVAVVAFVLNAIVRSWGITVLPGLHLLLIWNAWVGAVHVITPAALFVLRVGLGQLDGGLLAKRSLVLA